MKDEQLDNLYIYLMELGIKKYRQMAQNALNNAKSDLTIDQWIILKKISESHGSSQIEIAQSAIKDAPTTTRIIDQLLKRSLIVKEISSEDRRKFCLYLTEQGKLLVERLMPIVMDYREFAVRNFSEEDMNTFIRLLKRFIENFN